MKFLKEKCKGCGECIEVCPVNAMVAGGKKNIIINRELCVECNSCYKVCKFSALEKAEGEIPRETLVCRACPIYCNIKSGKEGACGRFINENGNLLRKIAPIPYDRVKEIICKEYEESIKKPLLTGIGVGTTAPCYKPAPLIVKDKFNGIDVVTCVTECLFSYCSMEVKVDTDLYLGETESPVTAGRNRKIGYIAPPGYGSQNLFLGGGEMTTEGSVRSYIAVKILTDLANRKQVDLKVRGGSKFSLQVGKSPIINGVKATKMRFGCGGATLNILGKYFKGVADEVIVIDFIYTGLFSEFPFVQRDQGVPYSGVELNYRRNTPGRYYGIPGGGWGQSNIENPLDIIKPNLKLKKGMTLFITEPTGQQAKLYCYQGEREGFDEIELTAKAKDVLTVLKENTEDAKVSALLIAEAGGSARGGITTRPLKLNEAIRAKKANITIGGTTPYIYPGGGIRLSIDVEKVLEGSFSWVPSPAIVIPMEYTMRLEDYTAIGGHMDHIRPLKDVLQEFDQGKRFRVPELGW